jgi:hypothetical protein
MVRELARGEVLKASPFWGQEIGQYNEQTVTFRASKKAPSIAAICTFGPASYMYVGSVEEYTYKELG